MTYPCVMAGMMRKGREGEGGGGALLIPLSWVD